MKDEIISFENSVIQHGKHNNRIYLIRLGNSRVPSVIKKLDELAEKHLYSKIFAKIPEWAGRQFEGAGYKLEAKVPCFYDGQVGACFMGKYFDGQREKPVDEQEIKKNLEISKQKGVDKKEFSAAGLFRTENLTQDKAGMIADIFKKVFKTYPFPVHDPAYIEETMRDNVEYFGAWEKNKLVAVSSAEKDFLAKNAEMTDFATLPEYRGKNSASLLLEQMEISMKRNNFKTVYTIARALSCGMNVTFARAGYKFGGTLINNTNICGKIESMNVWYKPVIKS